MLRTFLFLLVPSIGVGLQSNDKSVLLWVATPFGFWGGPFNQTKMDQFLNATAKLKDVVDVMSVVSYGLAKPGSAQAKETGGLVLYPNADVVIKALQKQGFQVDPLVGDFYGQNKIDTYRYYFASTAFRNACISAVTSLGLDGLNFDFEPGDCASNTTTPCSADDAAKFAKMLTGIKDALRGKGPKGFDARVSVDTGQSTIAKTNFLNVSEADLFMTMNTYYGRSDFDIALPRDLGIEGAARFSLGVCPGCFNSSESDIVGRMSEATRLGVKHLAYWAGTSDPQSIWWREIRKWKAAPAEGNLVLV